jgi:hypothetical protein
MHDERVGVRCTDELQKPGGLDAVLQSGYGSTTGKGPGGQLIAFYRSYTWGHISM